METKSNFRSKYIVPAMLVLVLAFATAANASHITWAGTHSSSWNDAQNWNGGIPVAGDDVLIPSAAVQPVMDADATMASLTIDGGGMQAVLTLDGVHNLTVKGNIVLKGREDRINSSSSFIILDNGGSLTGDGGVDLTGKGKLFISGDLKIATLTAGRATGSKVIMQGENQTVQNGGCYHFNDLNIHSGTTYLVHTNLVIDGNLFGGGILNGGDNKIQLAGDMMLVEFDPGTSTFELASAALGKAVIQHLNTNTFYNLVIRNRNTILSGDVNVTHNLDFEEGDIYLGLDNVNIAANAKITRKGASQISCTGARGNRYFVAHGKGSVKMADLP